MECLSWARVGKSGYERTPVFHIRRTTRMNWPMGTPCSGKHRRTTRPSALWGARPCWEKPRRLAWLALGRPTLHDLPYHEHGHPHCRERKPTYVNIAVEIAHLAVENARSGAPATDADSGIAVRRTHLASLTVSLPTRPPSNAKSPCCAQPHRSLVWPLRCRNAFPTWMFRAHAPNPCLGYMPLMRSCPEGAPQCGTPSVRPERHRE